MPPRCKSCREGETYDQPLFECISCGKRFHSQCHRPHPQEKSKNNWTCQGCLIRSKDREKGRYNDNASVSSSATSRALSSVHSSRRSSPAMSATSHSISSFTTEGGESDPPKLIICSYPGCIEKTLSSNIFCHAHQQLEAGLFAPAAPVPEASEPPQAFRSLSANINASTEVGRTLPSGIKPNKLLPENDKDRPILRRKTALRDPHIPRQSTSRQTTTSSSDDSTVSPTSPKQILARFPVHSPHGSPDSSRGSEPIRKRLKISHPSNGNLEARPNGTHTIGPDRGDFGVRHKLAKVQPYRPSFNSSSQQRPGRGPESERNGFRLSSQNRPSPVRKMAPQNLRPIPGLGVVPVSIETQQPSTELAQGPTPVNGFGLHGSNTSHQSVQNPLFHHNKGAHGFMGNFDQPIASHNSNKPPFLNGHVEQGSANNGTNQRSTPKPEPPHSQTHLNFQRENTESTMPRSQPHVAAMPRIQKPQTPQTPQGLSTGMTAPMIRQPNHVKAAITAPSKVIDEAAFDTLIYQQEGASTPPPEVLIPPPETPALDIDPPDEPIYADVDPRIHWTLPRPEAWLESKLNEIQLRDGRKANFGRAALSLKKQRLEEEQSSTFEETLPEKIADNPAWLRALRKLEIDAKEASVSQAINGTTKRKPGPKRQLSNGSGSNSVRGNIPELQMTNRAGIRKASKRTRPKKSTLSKAVSRGRGKEAKEGRKEAHSRNRSKAKYTAGGQRKTLPANERDQENRRP